MKKIISFIIAMIIALPALGAPASAADTSDTSSGVQTAILTSCGSGDENGIFCILNLVVNIMTIGIGVLGVLGITIVGIQYLTAGGNEEQTRKAKRRMYEIVIGLVAYVLVYALLNWLIPNFQPLIGG